MIQVIPDLNIKSIFRPDPKCVTQTQDSKQYNGTVPNPIRLDIRLVDLYLFPTDPLKTQRKIAGLHL